jgi:rRNA maturation endonuclease Nob1
MSVIDKLNAAFSPDEQTRNPPYACKCCDSRFAVQYQVCPECGGYSIERVNWSEIIGSE